MKRCIRFVDSDVICIPPVMWGTPTSAYCFHITRAAEGNITLLRFSIVYCCVFIGPPVAKRDKGSKA